MRPSLSPLLYGANGTPLTNASVVVVGPQASSDGSEETMSARLIGILIPGETSKAADNALDVRMK